MKCPTCHYYTIGGSKMVATYGLLAAIYRGRRQFEKAR